MIRTRVLPSSFLSKFLKFGGFFGLPVWPTECFSGGAASRGRFGNAQLIRDGGLARCQIISIGDTPEFERQASRLPSPFVSSRDKRSNRRLPPAMASSPICAVANLIRPRIQPRTTPVTSSRRRQSLVWLDSKQSRFASATSTTDLGECEPRRKAASHRWPQIQSQQTELRRSSIDERLNEPPGFAERRQSFNRSLRSSRHLVLRRCPYGRFNTSRITLARINYDS